MGNNVQFSFFVILSSANAFILSLPLRPRPSTTFAAPYALRMSLICVRDMQFEAVCTAAAECLLLSTCSIAAAVTTRSCARGMSP